MLKTAARLGRPARRGKRRPAGKPPLPSLWFVTDPERTPDPEAIVARLPRGAGVIYRGFGAPEAGAMAARLRALTARRGIVLLIGADTALAAAVGADGVHLPERLMDQAQRLRRAKPHWLITAAAHGPCAVSKGGGIGLDALLVSVIFPSLSPSARPAVGVTRLAALARGSKTPVIALGGVNDKTAPRLIGAGVRGLAAVEGFGAWRPIRT
jgi:thiamine-phosphate pyrophosphorylase